MSLLNSRYRIAGGIVCTLLLSSGALPGAFAQTPAPDTSHAAQPNRLTVIADPAQEKAFLAFRQGMAVAVQKAQSGDTAGASKALQAAVAAGQNRFDLPRLSDVLSDSGARVPGSLMKEDAIQKGMPCWLLEALVRYGATDAAKTIAKQQTTPLDQYRALCLVAVAQSGRYLNSTYVLPPVVELPPEKWIARTDVPGTAPGMVRALRVESLTGPTVAPFLDCRPLEKQGTLDNNAAFATLREAGEPIKETHDISLSRELSEIQGKMGDKPGALVTVQQGAAMALADWPTVKKDKAKAENARQEMGMLATDLEALGDKPTAEHIRKTLAANDFQQIWLSIFLTINIGALLIAYMMKRASKTTWISRAGDASAARS